MATDSLFVVDTSKINPNLTGRALQSAYWNARVAIDDVPTSASGVSEHVLDYHACWAGVFEDGPPKDWESIETIYLRDGDGNVVEETSLGILELRHLDAMIASVEANRERIQVGTPAEQLGGLTAIRSACTKSPTLRAVYHIDF
jgi:hypothetical protein